MFDQLIEVQKVLLEHRFSNQDKVQDCSVVLVKILALDMKIMNNGGTAEVK